MPITTAFTFAALVAGIANCMFLLRALEKRRQLHLSGQNGELAKIANAFIKIWVTILVADLFVVFAGVGILTGHREFGYLLAGMPIASTFVGIFALKGLLND